MGLFERIRLTARGNEDDLATRELDALRLIDEGNALEDRGRIGEALEKYDAAIYRAPKLARAHLNRGNVLLAMGRADAAVQAYKAALRENPKYAAAHYNLGNAYARSDRPGAALAPYRRAIALNPEFVDAEVALGAALEDTGQPAEAVARYRRALEINPNHAEVLANLGSALKLLGQLDEGLTCCRRAVEIRPDYADGYVKLGNLQQDLGQLDDAVTSFRRALEVKPEYYQAHSNLLFCLSHDESITCASLFAEHCNFGERYEKPLRASWPTHRNVRDPARVLQIGFVSGDLHAHPMTYFVEPLLKHLAGCPTLMLHAYSNHAAEDSVTKRLSRHFKHWHRISSLSDDDLAKKIGDDGIDVLVDLSGHTGEHRLLTFARKPAPVQASWMGYPGTTGLRAMDYYFADRHFLPVDEFAGQFTEKLVHLPASAPFLPDENAPSVNALPALTNGYVTFGSFNRLSKLRPSVIALWSQLLRAIPEARMVLGGMPQNGQRNPLIEWFARDGITRDRLAFHPRCETASYLRLHHQVDICLDTYPYSGGTTTAHALWMGVPTLSLTGHTPAGRQGAAFLGQVDLTEFLATDATDFERKGVSRSADLGALAGIRAGLRMRCEQSPARRPEVIAAGLERALRSMWQRWCAGLPPEAFEVSPPIMGSAILTRA